MISVKDKLISQLKNCPICGKHMIKGHTYIRCAALSGTNVCHGNNGLWIADYYMPGKSSPVTSCHFKYENYQINWHFTHNDTVIHKISNSDMSRIGYFNYLIDIPITIESFNSFMKNFLVFQ